MNPIDSKFVRLSSSSVTAVSFFFFLDRFFFCGDGGGATEEGFTRTVEVSESESLDSSSSTTGETVRGIGVLSPSPPAAFSSLSISLTSLLTFTSEQSGINTFSERSNGELVSNNRASANGNNGIGVVVSAFGGDGIKGSESAVSSKDTQAAEGAVTAR